ncbi:MAG: 50S ribosomal protein L30 [Acidimicrobiia bacterium]
MAKIHVTLVRSPIGQKPKTRATVASLGLRRLHQTVSHDDSPAIRGMVEKVKHLVEVREK